jgi:hypothetical protein
MRMSIAIETHATWILRGSQEVLSAGVMSNTFYFQKKSGDGERGLKTWNT